MPAEHAHLGPQEVEVLLEVDAEGRLRAVTPLRGPPELIGVVEAHLRGCAFAPATEQGEPIAVEIGLTLHLVPPPEPEPPPEVTLPSAEAVGVYRVGPETAASTLRFDRETLRTSPGAMGDPLRALQNAPGVVRTPLDSGWLLVRGGEPGDTAAFLDGVRIPHAWHLGGATSVIHPELVEEVVLWTGAWPARYGPALSGVVDVVPRQPGAEARAVAGVNLIFAHAFAETPLPGGGGVAAAARRSYLDAVFGVVLDDDRAGAAPRFWDAAVVAGGERDRVLLMAASDILDLPSSLGTVFTVRQTAAQLQARSTRSVGPVELDLRTWLAGRWRHFELQTFRDQERWLHPGMRLEAGGAGPLRAGVEAEHVGYRLSRDTADFVPEPFEDEAEEVLIPGSTEARSRTANRLDPYAEIGLGDAFRVEAGVRLETLFITGHLPRVGLSPRGAMRIPLLPDLSLVTEVARTHRPPDTVLLLALPEGRYLPLESALLHAAGLRYERPRLGLSLDGWHRRFTNLARFERSQSVGAFSGRAWGVDAAAAFLLPQGEVRLMAQTARSLRQEDRGLPYRSHNFDQPHQLQVLGRHALPWDLLLVSRFRHVAGFPVMPGDRPFAYDILQQREVRLRGERLPPYHALDLGVRRSFPVRHGEIEAFLDFQNVYGRRVPEPAIHGLPQLDGAYGVGLPFLPIFGVEGRFGGGQLAPPGP